MPDPLILLWLNELIFIAMIKISSTEHFQKTKLGIKYTNIAY